MRSDNYIALSQRSDHAPEKEHLPSSEDYAENISVEVPHRGTTPQWVAMAVILLLLINVCCSLVTMQQLQLASRVLKQFLNYADNRDLPRPDPYDGL